MSFALVLSLALAQVTPEAAPEPVQPKDVPPVVIVDSQKVEQIAAPVVSTPWWQNMTLNGFARIGVFYTFPFQDQQLVCSNGGFRVADFFIGLEFKPLEKFTVYPAVELAAPLVNPNDP